MSGEEEDRAAKCPAQGLTPSIRVMSQLSEDITSAKHLSPRALQSQCNAGHSQPRATTPRALLETPGGPNHARDQRARSSGKTARASKETWRAAPRLPSPGKVRPLCKECALRAESGLRCLHRQQFAARGPVQPAFLSRDLSSLTEGCSFLLLFCGIIHTPQNLAF